MANKLMQAVRVLQDKLPEFTVSILPPREMDGIKIGHKIAVELPREHEDLRVTLRRQLSEKTGLSFHSDSRARDGVCIEAEDPQKLLDAIRAAAGEGKLDGFTIDYLASRTDDRSKQAAVASNMDGGRLAQALLGLAAAEKEKDRSGGGQVL